MAILRKSSAQGKVQGVVHRTCLLAENLSSNPIISCHVISYQTCYLHLCASVTKQYNWYRPSGGGVIASAGKVTVGHGGK